MRRIKQALIKYISLCPKGANQLPVIYKSDDQVELQTLTKFNDEAGEILAVVYAPELRDAQGDIASADVIKDAAYEFAKQGEGIDIRHNEKVLSKEDAYVAESFIIQKGDPRFSGMTNSQGKEVDVTGGWGVVIKVNDEGLRAEYRDGKWEGVSMGGHAAFMNEDSPLDKETLYKHLRDYFNELKKREQSQEDIDMTPEELQKALDDSNNKLVESLAKLLKPEEKKEEEKVEKTDDAPEFKGDISDAEALRKHAKEVKIWNLQKETDFTDPKAVENFAAAVEELNKEDEGDEADAKEARKAELRKELAELEGKKLPASNQSKVSKTEEKEVGKCFLDPVGKEDDADLAAIGLEMADFINKQRGYDD